MDDPAELRIVNGILATLGQGTTSTLETQHPDVLQAITRMSGQDFQFQSLGWSFNTDYDVTLVPSTDGTVAIPATALSFKITDAVLKYLPVSEKQRYTRRGNLVYDSIEHSTNIGKTLRADIVTQLAIGDLPPIAQTYLGCLCNEDANLGDDGDMQKQSKLEDRTMLAWGRLHAHELRVLAVSALDSPQAQKMRHRGSTAGLGVNPLYPGG